MKISKSDALIWFDFFSQLERIHRPGYGLAVPVFHGFQTFNFRH